MLSRACRLLALLVTAVLVLAGLSSSFPAGARGDGTSSVTMTFKQPENLPKVQEAYLCDEPCFKKLQGDRGYQYPDSDLYVDVRNDGRASFTDVPPGTYAIVVVYVQPQDDVRIGYVKADETKPRVTEDFAAAYTFSLADASVDLGQLPLFDKATSGVPGRIGLGKLITYDDRILAATMKGRGLPHGTRIVTTYRTCSGATVTHRKRADRQGRAAFSMSVRIRQVSRQFEVSIVLTHPAWKRRVVEDGFDFPRRYKTGC